MKKPILFLSFLIGSLITLTTTITTAQSDSILPKVFILGEETEGLSSEYETLLMTACNDDPEVAFSKWVDMVLAIEAYSEKTTGFDIRGTKMWIKVFWDKDGTIDYISYFLKPTSKNIPVNELNAFFKAFMSTYKLPLDATTKYHHYGAISFPSHYKK